METKQSLFDNKTFQIVALTFAALFALVVLAVVIYAFVLLAYVSSAAVLCALFGCGVLAIAVSVGLLSIAVPLFPAGFPAAKTIRNASRPLLIAGAVIFCVALAFGGFSSDTWTDSASDARVECGYRAEIQAVQLRYDDVSLVECTTENVTYSRQNDIVIVEYSENYVGQFVISRDGSVLLIRETTPPDYPKALWWAFK